MVPEIHFYNTYLASSETAQIRTFYFSQNFNLFIDLQNLLNRDGYIFIVSKSLHILYR